MSISWIARFLNRFRTTIYKEIKYGTTTRIKQNKKKLMYLADTSQAVYERNRINSNKPFKIFQVFDFINYAHNQFYKRGWPFDASYKTFNLDNLFNKTICTKTLYNYLN